MKRKKEKKRERKKRQTDRWGKEEGQAPLFSFVASPVESLDSITR